MQKYAKLYKSTKQFSTVNLSSLNNTNKHKSTYKYIQIHKFTYIHLIIQFKNVYKSEGKHMQMYAKVYKSIKN